MDFFGSHRLHQGRRRIGNRRRRSGRSIHPFGRIHRAGTLPDRFDRRARAVVLPGDDRSGVVEPPHRRGARRSPHAGTYGQSRHELLPAGARRGRRPAGTGRGHLRHGGRGPVPLGRHVPRPHGDRQGDTGDLRRQNHGHLRQKFADGAAQRPAGRRGRLSVGQLRPRIAHRDGKRREIPRKLGERPEDGLFPRPARKPRTGETLRQRPHGAQHLLLHGRILGLRHGGRRPKGLLGGLLRTRRDSRHRKHGAQLRPGRPTSARLRPTPWSISRTSATNTT